MIDNLSSGKRANLEAALAAGAQLHELDVRDAAAVAAVFARRRPSSSSTSPRRSTCASRSSSPAGDAATNVLGTIAVLRGGARPRARGGSSTPRPAAACTATPSVLPTPEDHPIAPLAPYGQSKYAAEGYCALYTRLHGLSTVSLRYGNVYGPRQDVHGEAGVVAIFCGHLLEGRTPAVFGDGGQTRDWVDVSDVVRGQPDRRRARPDRAGQHRPRPGDLGARPARRARRGPPRGPLAEPRFAPERPGEVRRSCLDVTRARTELGWEPRCTLREGLARILAGLT